MKKKIINITINIIYVAICAILFTACGHTPFNQQPNGGINPFENMPNDIPGNQPLRQYKICDGKSCKGNCTNPGFDCGNKDVKCKHCNKETTKVRNLEIIEYGYECEKCKKLTTCDNCWKRKVNKQQHDGCKQGDKGRLCTECQKTYKAPCKGYTCEGDCDKSVINAVLNGKCGDSDIECKTCKNTTKLRFLKNKKNYSSFECEKCKNCEKCTACYKKIVPKKTYNKGGIHEHCTECQKKYPEYLLDQFNKNVNRNDLYSICDMMEKNNLGVDSSSENKKKVCYNYSVVLDYNGPEFGKAAENIEALENLDKRLKNYITALVKYGIIELKEIKNNTNDLPKYKISKIKLKNNKITNQTIFINKFQIKKKNDTIQTYENNINLKITNGKNYEELNGAGIKANLSSQMQLKIKDDSLFNSCLKKDTQDLDLNFIFTDAENDLEIIFSSKDISNLKID